MGISSPGVGANLDVNSIVSQLMAVEKQPLTRLDTKAASFQAKLSGFGTLKSVLSTFQTALNGLSDASKFQGVKTSVGDSAVATVSGSSVAVPGSYSLEVIKLAQAQKLNAVGQVSSTAPIGSGATTTLSFDFGTITGGTLNPATGTYTGAGFSSSGTGVKTVTIDATNNSLTGIRDAINKAAVGVTASIVNDGSGTPYRLSLSSAETGKTNSLKLSVDGDAALSSLLAHDPANASGQALSETVTAQNADFKIDGIAVTKPSNKVADAIAGVTLNLTKTNVGAPTTIGVTRDTDAVVTAVNGFVKAYNEINQNLKDATAFNPTTKVAAVLNGEASVRSIQNEIRSVMTAPVSGGGSTFTLLSQIGVAVQKDGSLGVDATKLQASIASNFSDFAGLFSNVGKTSDALVAYVGSTNKTAAGSYAVTVSELATQGLTTATGAAGLNITAGANDTLTVLLDGITSSITLAPGTYTSTSMAKELQSKINGNKAFNGATVSVADSGGILSITSGTYGTTSHAEITGGNGQADLKFDTGATVKSGKNTAGTINGVAAVGSGQTLVGAAGNGSEGLIVQVSGGIIGSRGNVNYSQGYAYQLNKLTTALMSADGPIASRTDGINSSLKDIAKNKDVLNARLVLVEKRYRAQFTTLDQVIGKMSTTSTFLSQQLANLVKNS